jgi:hypothetical protein
MPDRQHTLADGKSGRASAHRIFAVDIAFNEPQINETDGRRRRHAHAARDDAESDDEHYPNH